MERFKPPHVARAVKAGDQEAIMAFAHAGGKRSREKAILKEIDAEIHQESMQQMADERRDDLLPND